MPGRPRCSPRLDAEGELGIRRYFPDSCAPEPQRSEHAGMYRIHVPVSKLLSVSDLPDPLTVQDPRKGSLPGVSLSPVSGGVGPRLGGRVTRCVGDSRILSRCRSRAGVTPRNGKNRTLRAGRGMAKNPSKASPSKPSGFSGLSSRFEVWRKTRDFRHAEHSAQPQCMPG